ncbi:MAG: hemerythrin domain-containing protein [Acidobacteria bacterium]|nr:hemerythrin domain-containing protein [Acidobacteriota bacterium]
MITAEQLVCGPKGEGGSLDRPVEHLHACHERIEQRLTALEKAAEALDGDRHDEALAVIERALAFFSTNGAWHTADEEESFFPRLRPLLDPAGVALLDGLSSQHEEGDHWHRELEAARGDAARFRQAVAALAAHYRAHIAVENSRLLPLAAQCLDTTALAGISEEMKRRRSLLTGS